MALTDARFMDISPSISVVFLYLSHVIKAKTFTKSTGMNQNINIVFCGSNLLKISIYFSKIGHQTVDVLSGL